jgi:hypothetical protein
VLLKKYIELHLCFISFKVIAQRKNNKQNDNTRRKILDFEWWISTKAEG